jgi:putative acetyltransferase
MNGEPVRVREELPEDIPAIRRVNELAFGQMQEADIIDALRRSCPELLSLVAVAGDGLVGHILFSSAVIETGRRSIRGMGLAPMAVLPEWQRRGVGSLLVREGLERLRSTPAPFVIVLGHPDFYPRFGFEPCSRHGIRCPWEGVPDEAFMIRILQEPLLRGVTGMARYRPEFDGAV